LIELENDTQVYAPPARHLAFSHLVDGHTAYHQFAGSRLIDAGEHIQERRFATARLANHGHEFTLLKAGADAFQRREVAGGSLVNFDNVLHVDQRAMAGSALLCSGRRATRI